MSRSCDHAFRNIHMQTDAHLDGLKSSLIFCKQSSPLGINTVHSCHLLLEDSYGRIIKICVVYLSCRRCRTHRMDSYVSLVLVMNFSVVCRVYILKGLKLS